MKHIAAIDFGTSKVAVAAGIPTSTGLRIVAYEQEPVTVGIKNGEITNDTKVEQNALLPAIRRVEEKIGEKITEAYVNISGRFIYCKENSYSAIRPKPENDITISEINGYTANQFKRSMDDPATCVFEAIAQNYNIDDNIGCSKDEIDGMTGKNIDIKYKIIYGNESILNHREKVLDNCGIRMKKAILSSVASGRAVLTAQEMENGVAIADIGKGCTQVAIIKDNIVRDVYSIPFGGESITNDIKHITNLSGTWAERVKVEYGYCIVEAASEAKKLILHGENGVKEGEVDLYLLTKIVEARISEILEAVNYVIEQSGYANKISGGVVLTGGTCYLPYLSDLAKAIMQKKVRIAAPAHITKESCADSFDTFASTVVGLIMEEAQPLLSNPVTITQQVEDFNESDSESASTGKEDDQIGGNTDKKDKNQGKHNSFFENLFKNDNHSKNVVDTDNQSDENPVPKTKSVSKKEKSESDKTGKRTKKKEDSGWNLFGEMFTDNNNA